jgi:hypothetical protein
LLINRFAIVSTFNESAMPLLLMGYLIFVLGGRRQAQQYRRNLQSISFTSTVNSLQAEHA